MKTAIKMFLLHFGSLTVSILPLIVTFILNKNEYFGTAAETFKLCTGGLIAVAFILLKVIGKLKIPNGIVLYGVIFVMAYLLEALLNDLLLLSGMALLGEFVDAIVFRPIIRKTKEKRIAKATADLTVAQLKDALKEMQY